MSQADLRSANSSINVLLIEDNPDDAEYIVEILSHDPRGFFHVDWADCLAQGIRELKISPRDVVLLDLSLPDSFGFDTVRRFESAAPEIPVVVLTGMNSEEMGIDSISKGAQEYVIKSANLRDVLPRTIRYTVQRFRMQQALKARDEQYREMKDAFISILSHEIRTPMTVIKGAVDNLKDGIGGPLTAKQLEFVEMAARSSNRLDKIIQNVLSLSRLESGKAILNRLPLKLNPLLLECGRTFADEARKKNIEIIVDVPDKLPAVFVDSDMMMQVMFNLLSNALRHARSTVWVRACWQNGVRVSVIDDGSGIPADQAGKLFDKFVQVKRSEKTRDGYKGTGLGLAICKQIMELHQGTITVENTPGLGAAFHLDIPIYNCPKE